MKNKTKRITTYIILFLSLIIFFSTLWVKRDFKFGSFEIFLYTILLPTSGTPLRTILIGILNCLFLPISITLVIYLLFNKLLNKNKNILFINKISILIVLILFIFSCLFTYKTLKIDKYLDEVNRDTEIFEKYGVNAREVNYIFPENKRNLILVYLESMEISYYNKENGGALEKNLIPELFDISTQYETFTSVDNQGYSVAPRTGWTIAADVGSLCGIPFGSMFEGNPELTSDNFLPGAYGIGDILHNNGYSNILMCGSDAHFASTDSFFTKHGNFEIEDYDYAIKQNWITDDYYAGWGYEDEALFTFAKIELLSRDYIGKPFFLVLKTIDTHAPNGFICEQCNDEYSVPIFNATRCSSKQVLEFVSWIQEQDFYKNTTIILMGDHLSMSESIDNEIDESYNRKPYFVIINSAIDNDNLNNRIFCTYDIFPTMLASMGIDFDSDRLGLGTNLYSNSQTLMEELGNDFFTEVSKHSKYYVERYVLNKNVSNN